MAHRKNAFAAALRGAVFASIAALCLPLAACAPERMPVPTPTVSETAVPRGDGVLVFGTLLPTTGTGSDHARAQSAGVELAVREINEAGGVNGAPVVVYHRDSADVGEGSTDALAGLVDVMADVMIGPSTTELAERILPTVIQTGMVAISPSSLGPGFAALEDDGRLFRTIPSVTLAAVALATTIRADQDVAFIYCADASGRVLHDTFLAALENGVSVVVDEGFTATTNSVARIVTAVSRADPDTIVIVSPFTAGAKGEELLRALSREGLAGQRLWLTGEHIADRAKSLPDGTLEAANAVLGGVEPDAEFAARVSSADPSVRDIRFAAEAYDATVLAALAAVAAENDSGTAVAGALAGVSTGGVACGSFGECREALRSVQDIDYNGVSGPLDFDENGDVRVAEFGGYLFDADNTATRVGATSIR